MAARNGVFSLQVLLGAGGRLLSRVAHYSGENRQIVILLEIHCGPGMIVGPDQNSEAGTAGLVLGPKPRLSTEPSGLL